MVDADAAAVAVVAAVAAVDVAAVDVAAGLAAGGAATAAAAARTVAVAVVGAAVVVVAVPIGSVVVATGAAATASGFDSIAGRRPSPVFRSLRTGMWAVDAIVVALGLEPQSNTVVREQLWNTFAAVGIGWMVAALDGGMWSDGFVAVLAEQRSLVEIVDAEVGIVQRMGSGWATAGSAQCFADWVGVVEIGSGPEPDEIVCTQFDTEEQKKTL